jgi:arylsulfatase A-like enzyme
MPDWKKVLWIMLFAFKSLLLIGSVEFILKTARNPALFKFSIDLVEITLIVGLIYGLLGALGSLIISLFLIFLRKRGRKIQVDYSLFLLWSLVAFVYAGYEVNTKLLPDMLLSHPFSIFISIVLFLLCFSVFYVLYMLLKPILFRSQPGKTTIGIVLMFFLTMAPAIHSQEDSSATYVSRSPAWSELNLLLITVDTLRPDHLRCYGYDGIRTPTIDGLAYEGIKFENTVTSIPITLPSHASIFTGLYPPAHGIRFNGAYALADSITTLAEVLYEVGYTTGAIVASYALDSEFGLDQGFMRYDDSYPAGNLLKFKYPEYWSSLSNLLLGQLLARYLPLDFIFSEPQRRADEVSTAAIDWLGKHGSKKFFLWLHYFDPHTPYDAPMLPGLGLPDTSIPDRNLISRDPPYKYWWGELNSLEDVYSLYDAEIEYTDYWIGRVMDKLYEMGVRDRTLIVFTADHGECLWEHKLAGHGYSVFDSEIKVPLILNLPGFITRGDSYDRFVELTDLFPTILDLLDIPILQKVQGRSILSFIGKEDFEETRLAYCETLWPKEVKHRKKGIRTEEWKYVTSLDGKTRQFFNIISDPNELHNLANERKVLADIFEERLVEISRQIGDTGGLIPDMDAEVEEKLKALGYVR